ncbi:aminodeoxychorismate/anthranilate synthase component II [Paraglaciecola sp. L3A3]|uniref:anthranilate synthase component II n=1 Tax=Paraglaciecola sp. L3A3 TaxID=2686358 RepID=UPI00131A73FD|nr:aminodeoxychorismate/anthranilate synthase component II [Paraglaciecola sp. L3A3]
MLLLIDNYDSFTHNLARYFEELGQEVNVKRNDEISCQDIENLAPEFLVFSPGPCTPTQAGITLEAIKQFAGKIPILGVCLGHQAIGQVFGATVIRANKAIHGKTSEVYHDNSQLFQMVSNPFKATRYHSLILDLNTLPDDFMMTAWCENVAENCCREIMGIEHKTLAIYGVQFHPESLLTEFGHEILKNFLKSTQSTEKTHE